MPAIHMSQEPRHALEHKLLVPAVCPTDDSDTEENTPSPASPAAGSGGATITSRRGSDKSKGGSSAVQEFRTDFRSRPGSSGRNRMITHAIDVKGKQQQQQQQEQHAQQRQQQQQQRHQSPQPQQHHSSRVPEESQNPALNVSPPRHSSRDGNEHSSGAAADGAAAAATAAAAAAGKEAAAGEGAQVAIPKRVSFVAGDGGIAGTASGSSPFRPSYEVFTPGPHALGTVQYRAPEKRVPSAVAPPSSVARPNYHDAIRRVAVVVFQHVQNCERRLARVRRAAEHPPRPPPPRVPPHATLGGGQPGGVSAPPPVTPGAVREAFDPAKADLFHEQHYVSPRYRCTFVRALGAAGALPCSAFAMAKVETEPTAPSVEAIYEFIRTLFNRACLSSECSLVCLIYIERLMEVAAVPLLATTWKPVVLCGLLLASKVWQDLSSWNVEFSTVYPEFSLRSINRLEHVYLAQVQWDLYISASLYAKYYFALRSLAEGRDFRRRYNCVVQIDAPRADRVQERSLAVREEAAKMFSKSL